MFIVIGIGGSYLGARAAIEFPQIPHYNALPKRTPDIYFTGNSISSTALQELLTLCEGKDVSINMISSRAPQPSRPSPSGCCATFWKKYGKEARRESTARPTGRAGRSKSWPTGGL